MPDFYLELQAKSLISLTFVAVLFTTFFEGSHEARILSLSPLPGTSHMISNTALPKELASRGHEVTVITPFMPEKPIPNYRVIPLRMYTREELFGKTGKYCALWFQMIYKKCLKFTHMKNYSAT